MVTDRRADPGLVPVGLTAALLLLVAPGALGQYSQPCPDRNALKGHTEWLCAELVPSDGRVWYRGSDGTPCYCPCMEAQVSGDPRVRREAANRSRLDSVFLSNKLKDPSPFAPFVQRPLLFPADTAEPRICHQVAFSPGGTDAYPCDDDSDLEALLCERIAPLSLLDGVRDRLALRYIRTSVAQMGRTCAGRFPASVVAQSYVNVLLPSTFIRHNTVTEELLVFLFFHELGHALWGSSGTLDETLADAWAIEVGMRAFYTHGTDYLVALEKVQVAMRSYFEAVYGPDVVELAHLSGVSEAMPDHISDYPRLECRTELIGTLPSGTYAATEGQAPGAVQARIHNLLTTAQCWVPYTNAPVATGQTYCGSTCAPPNDPITGLSDHILDRPMWEIMPGPWEETDGIPPVFHPDWAGLVKAHRTWSAQLIAMKEQFVALCAEQPSRCTAPTIGTRSNHDRWVLRTSAELRSLQKQQERMDRAMRRLLDKMAADRGSPTP